MPANPDDNMHQGHRARLRERFANEGLQHFEDHEALELLLFYAMPRRNTNDIAHRLVRRFGSLEGVLFARVQELTQVKGVGAASACLIALMGAMIRWHDVPRRQKRTLLNTAERAAAYVKPHFRGRKTEAALIVCLDGGRNLVSHKLIDTGSAGLVGVPVSAVASAALMARASYVLLAHNHPSGLCLPSPEDQNYTRKLCAALATLDLELTDHIIVADDETVSMAGCGFL